jgi:hypothetical protein
MYVETHESKQAGLPFLYPQRERDRGNDQSECEVVKGVVILGKP